MYNVYVTYHNTSIIVGCWVTQHTHRRIWRGHNDTDGASGSHTQRVHSSRTFIVTRRDACVRRCDGGNTNANTVAVPYRQEM